MATKFIVKIQESGMPKAFTLRSVVFDKPEDAIEKAKALALHNLDVLLRKNNEAEVCCTSDSRYPDAWGFVNNGFQVKSNGKVFSYWVEEIVLNRYYVIACHSVTHLVHGEKQPSYLKDCSPNSISYVYIKSHAKKYSSKDAAMRDARRLGEFYEVEELEFI